MPCGAAAALKPRSRSMRAISCARRPLSAFTAWMLPISLGGSVNASKAAIATLNVTGCDTQQSGSDNCAHEQQAGPAKQLLTSAVVQIVQGLRKMAN